ALREWFRTEFHRDINQSTLSESLSAESSHLDSDQGRLQRTQQREKAIRWPVLEKALIKWIEESQTDLPLTGHLLKTRAARFWRLLDCYQGMK
ncbi:CENP-B-like protein 1, partial [Erysiphe neolycopersici]